MSHFDNDVDTWQWSCAKQHDMICIYITIMLIYDRYTEWRYYLYFGDEDTRVVNTEWMACVALTSNNAETERTTRFEYSQRLGTAISHPSTNSIQVYKTQSRCNPDNTKSNPNQINPSSIKQNFANHYCTVIYKIMFIRTQSLSNTFW